MTRTSNRSGAGVIGPSPCWSYSACPCCGASANRPWSTCVSSASCSAWVRPSHGAGAHGRPSNASSASGWPPGCPATSSASAHTWRR